MAHSQVSAHLRAWLPPKRLALCTVAHVTSTSAELGPTQPATRAAQAAPHAFAACHENLQQRVAEHGQGDARRMPLDTPAVDPPSAQESRAAAASALSLAGTPPHTTPDRHTARTTPRPYKSPVATVPALTAPLSADTVATARERAAAALDPPPQPSLTSTLRRYPNQSFGPSTAAHAALTAASYQHAHAIPSRKACLPHNHQRSARTPPVASTPRR